MKFVCVAAVAALMSDARLRCHWADWRHADGAALTQSPTHCASVVKVYHASARTCRKRSSCNATVRTPPIIPPSAGVVIAVSAIGHPSSSTHNSGVSYGVAGVGVDAPISNDGCSFHATCAMERSRRKRSGKPDAAHNATNNARTTLCAQRCWHVTAVAWTDKLAPCDSGRGTSRSASHGSSCEA